MSFPYYVAQRTYAVEADAVVMVIAFRSVLVLPSENPAGHAAAPFTVAVPVRTDTVHSFAPAGMICEPLAPTMTEVACVTLCGVVVTVMPPPPPAGAVSPKNPNRSSFSAYSKLR